MLLAREFIGYLSRQIVRRFSPQIIETPNPEGTADLIAGVIEDELAIEDRLNDEVRDLLEQYSEEMRKEGISYHEMFRRIKNTLITQRKVIRASGDSRDQMKLSRDKVNDISHKVMAALRKARDIRIRKATNDARLELVKVITEILQLEDRVDRAARTRIRSQKREITEGTEEWDLLHKRYYAEEMKKLGLDLAR